MKPIIYCTSLAMLAASWAYGRPVDDGPTFEVASVKVAEQPKPDAQGRLFISRGCQGGLLPRSQDPSALHCTNIPLKQLVIMAYGLKTYQVEGPAFLDTEGFDIAAKVPLGTTKEQFDQMLRHLLAERFKLTVHHETKSMQVYVLSIAKGGSKMKELDAATIEKLKAEAAAAAAAAPPPGAGRGPMPVMPPMPPPPPGGGGSSVSFSTSGFGPPGRGGTPPAKGFNARTSMTMSNGNMSRTLSGYLTMEQLTNSLSQALDRPVTDLTELKGVYDIDLAWVPTGNDAGSMGNMRMAVGMASAMAGGGGGGGGAAEASDPGGFNLPEALQASLGLKLEQKKAPGDMLIIDHVERVPTEN
jgi:uncharacterized protein (TIGR03435 family)